MKKITLLLVLGGLFFAACQKDDPSSGIELDDLENSPNFNVDNEKEDAFEFCTTNVMPDLPSEPVQICATDKGESLGETPNVGTDTPSYFDITAEGTFFNAWCVDYDTPLAISESIPDDCIEAHLYSSYDSFVQTLQGPGAGQFEKPDNFDLVNYVLNTYTAGVDGITLGDIQKALWDLIDDCVTCESAFATPSTQANVDDIVADALANGEGYIPGEGDELVIIAIPKNGPQGEEYQNLIFTIPVKEECQTN